MMHIKEKHAYKTVTKTHGKHIKLELCNEKKMISNEK
jgi:hypothetical protein